MALPSIHGLAQRVTSHVGQRTLLAQHPTIADSLAINKHLSEDLWRQLFHKAPARTAVALVSRPLSAQLTAVALRDKRVTVREALLKHFGTDASALAAEIVAAPWFARRYAEMWARSGNVPAEAHADVALTAGGQFLAKALGDPALFTLDQAAEILANRVVSAPQALTATLTTRAELLPFAVRSARAQTRAAAADSSALHGTGLQLELAGFGETNNVEERNFISAGHHVVWNSLLQNPNCTDEVVEKMRAFITTIRASMSTTVVTHHLNRYVTLPGVPVSVDWSELFEAPEQNPMRQRLLAMRPYVIPRRTLASMERPTSAPYRHPDGFADCEPRLDALGAGGWEAFWSLLPGWGSDLPALVDAAASLRS